MATRTPGWSNGAGASPLAACTEADSWFFGFTVVAPLPWLQAARLRADTAATPATMSFFILMGFLS